MEILVSAPWLVLVGMKKWKILPTETTSFVVLFHCQLFCWTSCLAFSNVLPIVLLGFLFSNGACSQWSSFLNIATPSWSQRMIWQFMLANNLFCWSNSQCGVCSLGKSLNCEIHSHPACLCSHGHHGFSWAFSQSFAR